MGTTNAYVEAARSIPKGETRTFAELAAAAGKPGAARAAGRAIRAARAANDGVPWHRVVRASGEAWADDEQVHALRTEGARPRDGEAVRAFASRVGAEFVGRFRDRVLAPAEAAVVERWRPLEVEPFRGRAAALARGFCEVSGEREPLLPRPHSVHASANRAAPPIARRVADLEGEALGRALAGEGHFTAPAFLTPAECAAILRDAAKAKRFERTIEMGAKGYGIGTYHYFREPIPAPLGELRELLYSRLRPHAEAHRADHAYPPTLEQFWTECRRAGQHRASSIVLCYGEGGVNHPHRDLYGPKWFPFQALVVLSQRGRDFEGGEFVLLEEQPDGSELRRELAVDLGDVIVFCSRHRCAAANHRRKTPLRHGMNPITRGLRQAAGIVFHLAE